MQAHKHPLRRTRGDTGAGGGTPGPTRRTAELTYLQPVPMAFSSTVRRPRAPTDLCCWVRIQAESVRGSVCTDSQAGGGVGGRGGGAGAEAAAALPPGGCQG